MTKFQTNQIGQQYQNTKTGKVGVVTMWNDLYVNIQFGKNKRNQIIHRNIKTEEFVASFEIYIDPKGWEVKGE